MSENQNNIWNEININLPIKSKKQNINTKNIKIRQIEKEKTITQ
jgi:hypothetical protein